MTSAGNAYLAGNTHDFIFMNLVNEGNSGENVTWDFTSLQKNGKTLTSKMYAVTSSDSAALACGANIILNENGNLFYFKVTSDEMEQYGATTGNVFTQFDKPCAKLQFPMKYGDKVSEEYSGTAKFKTTENKLSGTCDVIADAYGTLLLPGNIKIENALRVKQTKTFTGSTQKEITYRWYASGVRYPILVIIKYESATQNVYCQTALYAHAGETAATTQCSATENSGNYLSSANVETYPNPYTDKFTLNYKLETACNVKIELIGINGKTVKTVINEAQDKGSNSVEVSSSTYYNPGTYFIKITAGDDIVTRKVVKQ